MSSTTPNNFEWEGISFFPNRLSELLTTNFIFLEKVVAALIDVSSKYLTYSEQLLYT